MDYQNRAREMMSVAHEQLYRQYQRERGIILFSKGNLINENSYIFFSFFGFLIFRTHYDS